jgi:hypothetical protein
MDVEENKRSAFHHRKNTDGTFDSICPVCFRTVASAKNESQLAELEHEHICEEPLIHDSQNLFQSILSRREAITSRSRFPK